eukprot:scaffold2251_cov73-Cyclotella_meneghiniana.AAC.6
MDQYQEHYQVDGECESSMGGATNDDESTLDDATSHLFEEASASSSSPPQIPRILTVATELETLCHDELTHISGNGPPPTTTGFPKSLLSLVMMFPGNHCCVDCGRDERGILEYGSVGYGTLLCGVCAERHQMYTEEESKVQSLTTATWTLHSILSLIASSNSNMLEYIRSKPRWRPPKSSTDSQEVLAYKQIYYSKAAADYRSMVSQWVEHTYREKLTQVQSEISAKERLYMMKQQSQQAVDPFDSIFARYNVSREDIPGFSNSNSTINSKNSNGLGDSFHSIQSHGDRNGGRNNSRRNVFAPSSEGLPMDVIRAKIHARRNRNPSIRAQQQQEEEGNPREEDSAQNYYQQQQQQQPLTGYNASYFRRRSDIVGEVGGDVAAAMQDQEYDDPEAWDSGCGGGDSMAGYTHNLPRYNNADVRSVGVSVASRGRRYDDSKSLGSIPLDRAGVPLATYRRTSIDEK